MAKNPNRLAVITGASSGIGYELSKCCAKDGFDLIICSEGDRIHDVAKDFAHANNKIEVVQADLSTLEGVDKLVAYIGDRKVDALLANAGVGLGKGFLEQELEAWRNIIDLNITGTLALIQKIAIGMRARAQGRILITGSIAGFMPGSFQAVYNGSKAFLDSFSFALRNELKNSGITVTCLMPGATETEFFERADLMDTKVGQSKKEDPAIVAERGFKAMMDGDAEVISGWMNKMRAAMGSIMPAQVTAEMHRKMAAPGTGKQTAA